MDVLRKNSRYFIIFVGLGLLLLLIRDFNSRMADLRRLTMERDHVSAQVTSLAATKVYLEAQIEYAQTDDAVRKWAYEQGKLSEPDDVVVIPLPAEGNAPSVEPTPLPPPENVQNWQLWLAMFMDQPVSNDANSP